MALETLLRDAFFFCNAVLNVLPVISGLVSLLPFLLLPLLLLLLTFNFDVCAIPLVTALFDLVELMLLLSLSLLLPLPLMLLLLTFDFDFCAMPPFTLYIFPVSPFIDTCGLCGLGSLE